MADDRDTYTGRTVGADAPTGTIVGVGRASEYARHVHDRASELAPTDAVEDAPPEEIRAIDSPAEFFEQPIIYDPKLVEAGWYDDLPTLPEYVPEDAITPAEAFAIRHLERDLAGAVVLRLLHDVGADVEAYASDHQKRTGQ